MFEHLKNSLSINSDRLILALKLKTWITKEKIKYKSGAFADNVGVVCRGDANSVQGILHNTKG